MAKRVGSLPRPVPPALAQVVAASAKRIQGKYCYGLPAYESSVKHALKLVELGDAMLFDENDVTAEAQAHWLPFARLGKEPQFLCIATEPPYAVGMWEHEDGEIHPVWPSIDDFVARLIGKSDKTPGERLDALCDDVAKLIAGKMYSDALARIEPALSALPDAAPRGRDEVLGRAYNLYGVALTGVKKPAEARAAFERSAGYGDHNADLNILDLLSSDAEAPEKVIEHALKLRERRHFDEHSIAWIARYLAIAHLDAGRPAEAEAELRALAERFAVRDTEKVREARAGLQAYIDADRPGAQAARGMLALLAERTYELTPAQASANRTWWSQLPAAVRDALIESLEPPPDEQPSDADIARCLELESLGVPDDEKLEDLSVLLPLQKLTRLSFGSDADSIEILRGLPKLERLTIDNRVIKGFQWPSRADRDLWKAAEDGDAAGVEKALAAGASVKNRDASGQSALAIAAMGSGRHLCEALVARGADPWATSHGENTVLEMFADEDREQLEAIALKAGISHPESGPWRTLTAKRTPRGATFEVHGKLDLQSEDSLAATWPADATFVMRSPKTDNKLADLMSARYGALLVSEALAAALRNEPDIELLPVTVLDHAKKPRPEKYFLLNPPTVDCLVVEQCFPQWNHIDPDSISEYAALVIDPARASGHRIFRPRYLNDRPVIVSRELALTLAPFTGVGIEHAKR